MYRAGRAVIVACFALAIALPPHNWLDGVFVCATILVAAL